MSLRGAVVLAAVLAGATLMGTATATVGPPPNEPNATTCQPSQLRLSISAFPENITDRRHKGMTQYATGFNVFAVNVGVAPCLLLGVPEVRLSVAQTAVEGKRIYEEQPLGPATVTDAPYRALLPSSPNGRTYGRVAGVWYAPFCGQRGTATVQVVLGADTLNVQGRIPPPPCKNGWLTGIYSGGWTVSQG